MVTMNELIKRNQQTQTPRVSIAELEMETTLLRSARRAQGVTQDLCAELASAGWGELSDAQEALQWLDNVVMAIEGRI